MSLTIDVIVRTLADEFRSKLLMRALDSIQDQVGIAARPIVVVNGERSASDALAALENRPGVLVHRQQQASTVRASAAGRSLVTAPYFAFMDDDDMFLEGALRGPLTWLDQHPHCDVLVTNGYFAKEGGALVESTHIADHVSRPDLSLVDENWLSPGASFFRTQSVTQPMFDVDRVHQEWTRLAYRLCAEGKRVHFSDVPTVIYNNTPGSMSKKSTYQTAELELLRLVYNDRRLHADVRQKIRCKSHNALHRLAMTYWKQGYYWQAWRHHLASMSPPYFFRYLLFSRKLLWPFGNRNGAKAPGSGDAASK